IAAVVPAFRVEAEIEQVICSLPTFLRYIIVVDDASPDATGRKVAALAEGDSRILLLTHERNQGVGGAVVTGFRKALELGAHIVVKIDGDGQMDPQYMPALLSPLVTGKADYTKGNRFRDFEALRQMPFGRRIANMALSFTSKAASGYWNCFDPANGYFAVRSEMLAQLPLERVDRRYYFETWMLANLYLLGAYVVDVPMPARYGNERSSLSMRQAALEFPLKLLGTLARRLWLKYFLYDFSMMSIYLLSGIPLILFGLIFGIVKWIKYAGLGIPAPTGTVILPTLALILGIQILLSAIEIDMNSVPRQPLTEALE
ncbi:MAG TPA: glycosyltransferase family 2 protein, partial [Anaerolineales bacterium]